MTPPGIEPATFRLVAQPTAAPLAPGLALEFYLFVRKTYYPNDDIFKYNGVLFYIPVRV
jgi:hypothetical protein